MEKVEERHFGCYFSGRLCCRDSATKTALNQDLLPSLRYNKPVLPPPWPKRTRECRHKKCRLCTETQEFRKAIPRFTSVVRERYFTVFTQEITLIKSCRTVLLFISVYHPGHSSQWLHSFPELFYLQHYTYT